MKYAEGTLIRADGIVFPIEHSKLVNGHYFVDMRSLEYERNYHVTEDFITEYLWAKTQIGKAQINGYPVVAYSILSNGDVQLHTKAEAIIDRDVYPIGPVAKQTHDEDGFIEQKAFDEWVEKEIPEPEYIAVWGGWYGERGESLDCRVFDLPTHSRKPKMFVLSTPLQASSFADEFITPRFVNNYDLPIYDATPWLSPRFGSNLWDMTSRKVPPLDGMDINFTVDPINREYDLLVTEPSEPGVKITVEIDEKACDLSRNLIRKGCQLGWTSTTCNIIHGMIKEAAERESELQAMQSVVVPEIDIDLEEWSRAARESCGFIKLEVPETPSETPTEKVDRLLGELNEALKAKNAPALGVTVKSAPYMT
jgi:hypothetical protein